MSGLIVGLVLRTPITDTFNSDAKFIATVYADHAWEDGTHAHPAVDTVAGIVGLHERTVQRYLRILENMGMLIPSGKGPRGTNQYSFPLESSGDGSVRLNLPRGGSVPPPQKAKSAKPARGDKGDKGDRESGDRESGGAIVSPKLTTRPLIHEEEEKAPPKFQISSELQGELKDAGVFKSIWTEIDKRITAGWTETDVLALLDWMTKTRRDKPKAAQGFVARVREGTKAPQEFYSFSQRRMNGKWFPGKGSEVDEQPASEPAEVEPEYVFMQADETVTPEIEQAWKSVLGQLASEMPRGSFTTWVQPSWPARFENDTLMVAAESEYVRDMLTSRLQSSVERLLVGILNRQVNVQFVVAVETEVM